MKIFNYIFCPFYKITNLYCPGCGITRMILSIIQGDFYQAFRYNPLLFLLIPVFVFLGINHIFHYKFLSKRRQEKFYIILVVLLLLFGILRNIPLFSYLAPTKVR